MNITNISENILTQFLKSIPQYVWWKDIDSVFLGCNDNCARYIGLNSPKDIVGMSDFDIYDNKAEAESVRKMDQEIIRTGKSQLNFEECLTMPSVGKRWLSTSKIPLLDDDKNIIGTIGWFDDITEIKEMQIQMDAKNKALINYSLRLQETNRQLELVNIDLEKFTYAASHDLKSPIRILKGFATILKEKESANLAQESLEYLDFICDSTDRMGVLIDGILNLAKTGYTDLKSKMVDLEEIVRDKIKDLKANQGTRNINLDLPQDKIQAYPDLIGLVFYNLINNGIKYNESETPQVDCTYEEKKNSWVFSIKDNGIGIKEEYAAHIFEPFKRLNYKKIEGSGLGLSICKRIVNLHRGQIWVQPTPEGGSLFQFTISKNL